MQTRLQWANRNELRCSERKPTLIFREGDFIKQIDTNTYESFVDRHFLLYRRGILKSKVKRDKVMQYKSVPIKKPLLKEALICKNSAVQINSLILR